MSLTYTGARSSHLRRSVAVAGVVAVHIALFFTLTATRHSINIVKPFEDTVAVFIPLQTPPTPQPKIEPKKLEPMESIPTPTPPQDIPIVPDIPPPVASDDAGISAESAPAEAPGAPANSFSIVKRVDPPYPSASRRAGEQGTVLLSIVIGPDGKPVEVTVAKSSGFQALDDSAVNAAHQWRFATNVSGEARVTVPITFRLQNVR